MSKTRNVGEGSEGPVGERGGTVSKARNMGAKEVGNCLGREGGVSNSRIWMRK